MEYTLGIDIGTTSVCAQALDSAGVAAATLSLPNKSFIASPDARERIQDPAVIEATVRALLEGIVARCGSEPSAICLTGQMHGIVYTDPDGNATGPLYTWQDQRSARPYKDGGSYVDFICRHSRYRVYAGYGLATHFYNTLNNAVPDNAVKFCTIHDYIAMRLCGLKLPLIHSSDAASIGGYDLAGGCFDTDAVRELGLDADMLPGVSGETLSVGKYKGSVPVVIAIGDNQASFLGSVENTDSSLLINIGTGSQISVVGKYTPEPPEGIECRPFTDGKYLLVGCSLCGGRAYAALEKLFRDIANMCGAGIDSAYDAMSDYIGKNEVKGSLDICTLLEGTRSNPEKRGYIRNISTSSLNPGELIYGFMHGIVSELYGYYRTVSDNGLCGKTDSFTGAGNGLRKNSALVRTAESVFGMPLILTKGGEEAAAGAAKLAARYLNGH